MRTIRPATAERLIKMITVIAVYQKERGRPISIRELGDQCELRSTSSVFRYIGQLKGLGLLETFERGSPRSLVVTEKGEDAIKFNTLDL